MTTQTAWSHLDGEMHMKRKGFSSKKLFQLQISYRFFRAHTVGGILYDLRYERICDPDSWRWYANRAAHRRVSSSSCETIIRHHLYGFTSQPGQASGAVRYTPVMNCSGLESFPNGKPSCKSTSYNAIRVIGE